MEKKLKKLEDTKEKEEKEKKEAEAIEGDPLYYTDMVSNLHAGKDFYLNSLQDNYQLSFSDDFASVMDEIEKEYKAKEQACRCFRYYRWSDFLSRYFAGKELAGYSGSVHI